jgi:DNA-binding CsgD family transcriptional regulator
MERRVISQSEVHWENIQAPEPVDIEDTLESIRFWGRVRAAVSPRAYEILELVSRNFTQYDIAKLLGISRDTVKTTIMRAKKQMTRAGLAPSMSPGHAIE